MVQEKFTLDFKGRQRTIRFGIGPSRILCQNKGITISEMNTLDVNEMIQDMIVASLEFDCLINNETIDFNQHEVYQLINDMDQEQFQAIFNVYLQTKVVGKSVYDLYLERTKEQSEAGEEKKS
jgi:hypothetical protein